MERFLLKLKQKLTSKYSLALTISILFIADMTPLAIAQKNILIFLIVFLMGYIVYSDNDYLEYMDENKGKSLIIALIFFIFYIGAILYYYHLNSSVNLPLRLILTVMRNGIMITTIVAIIGYGRKYLNKEGRVLEYLNKACFPIYILHQTVIVIIAYYLLNYTLPMYLSISIIVGSSVVVTFGVYEIFRRIKIMKFLIGIR